MLKRQGWTTLLLFCFVSGALHAETEFHIGGFGTLGVIHSSNHDADFSTDTKPGGAGYSRSIDGETDTLGGVQVDAVFNDRLSATVQVISKKNDGRNSFKPDVEWANLKWKVTPDFSIHLGRMGIPAFMVSDYRWVNYASVWERAPVEVYNQSPVTHGDGISVRYQTELGRGTFSTQAMYFSSEIKSPQGDQVKVNRAKLLNASYEWGALTGRILYAVTPFDFYPSAAAPLVGGLSGLVQQQVPGSAALLDHFFSPKAEGAYSALGVAYDPGSYFLQGEYVRRSSDKGFSVTTDAWYVLGGIRRGKWSPYVMMSQLKAEGPFSDPLASAMANGALGVAAIPLGQGINQVLALRNQSQTTTAVGVRYDVMKNVAIKAQYDHVKPKEGAYGMYNYPATQVTPVGSANLLSLNIDFVF